MDNDEEVTASSASAPTPRPAVSPKHDSAPRKRRLSFTRLLGYSLAALVAAVLNLTTAALAGAGALVAIALTDLPKTDALKEIRLQEPLRVYGADGGLMAEFGVERRSPVSFSEVPPLLIKAFLATEDARFFEHEGIDLVGIGRAAVAYARTGERSQGGSTITMQVARNFFLTREKTFNRKLSELLLSLHIERTLTKEEILELYLNKIFFGHRAYGVSAAAALYYGKPLSELSVAEMAMLAGIPKAPSANNPVSNPERARARRNYILRRMRTLGHLSEHEVGQASQVPVHARLHRKGVDLEAGYAAEMVRREIVSRFGDDAYREGFKVTTTIDSRLQRIAQDVLRKSLRDYDRRHGYHGAEDHYAISGDDDRALDKRLAAVRALPDLTAGIVTEANAKEALVYLGQGEHVTLELEQVKWARRFKSAKSRGPEPRRVTDAVAVGDLIRLARDKESNWSLSQIPSVSGALVVMSPEDGAIRALVGGYDFQASKFNRAVDARRQPGSSFKPFVYAAALERGYTPLSLVRDEPFSQKGWSPQNYDRKVMGRIPMRKALYLSRNLASVNLLNRVGFKLAREYIQRFGFKLEELPIGLSMALGTAEVSPLQMAGAYALFANGGFRVMPYFISEVENGIGEQVFKADPLRACADCWYRYEEATSATAPLQADELRLAEQALDPRVAYQMVSMMQDVIERGTGRRAKSLKRKDIAGKTGTTNDVRDSWFCGFQKEFVTVAWMGFDDFKPLGKGETGGQAGLGMWVDFMGEALKDKPQAVLDPPEGMVEKSGEWVPVEFANALQGPEPVGPASGDQDQQRGAIKKHAPRVIDELF